jgi:mannitol/fructose-specific phosphotransferase system IIA component (Ntr-type)
MVMVLSLTGAGITEALGMHPAFGGLVMGLAIGNSSRLREHTRKVLEEFVTSVFTPVFFATMALRIDFAASFDIRLILIVLTVACFAKIAACTVGARLAGVGWRHASAVGFGMNSRGAMEILLAVLALEAKIINASLFVALVVTAVVTSLISGPAVRRILRAPPSPLLGLLRGGVILLDLPTTTRAQTLLAMRSALAHRLGIGNQADAFGEAVFEREELGDMGFGEGLTIPHVEVPGLKACALALARARVSLDFNAADGQSAPLIFLFLTPPGQFERQPEMLAALSSLVIRNSVQEALLDAATEQDALGALCEAYASFPSNAPRAPTIRPLNTYDLAP